ncbi:MAG: molybdopterin-guanine dinucleotide biosynthesis protein B [Lachnospiraceae bacterium]|nr:molybdopterin-guanine dinucleotide biosynthesis protein B [Lachnospiraceae bacterium]
MQNKTHKLSIGILAGGKSSRMGENKALLKIGKDRVIDRLTKELGSFSELIISAAKKGEYESLGFRTVYDETKEIGPIEGIRAVLKAAKEEYVFICAADMPNITADFVRALSHFISSDNDCYVICDEDHIQPLCAIYKKSVLPVVEELIANGQYRLRMIFDKVNTKYIPIGMLNFSKKTVKNINTKDEYIEALKPFVFAVSGPSDSGKTGLIVKLINEFINENMSVCVLKHDGHDSLSDKSGSDTERFYEAGAVVSSAFSDSGSIMHRREETDLKTMLSRLSDADNPPDFIIVEGMKNSDIPKIEIVRKGVSEKPVCPPDYVICIATDFLSPHDYEGYEICNLNDEKEIFLRLKKYFLKGFYNETDKNN